MSRLSSARSLLSSAERLSYPFFSSRPISASARSNSSLVSITRGATFDTSREYLRRSNFSLTVAVILPIDFVILGMRQHVTNVDVSHRLKNDRNQPIIVPFDVEDHAIAVHIRMAKRVAHVREIPPVGAARHLVPFHQSRFGIRMFSPELPKSTLADNPHGRAPITNDPILGSPCQVRRALLNDVFPMRR